MKYADSFMFILSIICPQRLEGSGTILEYVMLVNDVI